MKDDKIAYNAVPKQFTLGYKKLVELSIAARPKCSGVDSCFKIQIIMGKDILDFQKTEAIKSVCDKCRRG